MLCAWNEEKYLPQILLALKNQTLPLKKIVVVNDGSTDETRNIALKLGCTVIDLPYHKETHVSTPKMAEKFNAGFKLVSWNRLIGPSWNENPDFIMVIGADDLLPIDYVEKIVERMLKDDKIVVASGQSKGQPSSINAPRGAGRLIKGWFWRATCKGEYPVSWGWEDLINYQANKLGYKTCSYPDIQFIRLRDQKRTWNKAYGDGRSMAALGHFWFYALLICFKLFGESPTCSIATFLGWFTARNIEKLEIADWLRGHQKRNIRNRTIRLIRKMIRPFVKKKHGDMIHA